MKTLKKSLGLILVIAMCFSMLSVAVSAVSFSDADDINEDFSTAVSAMSDLGIIEGYDDGSFQPETVLTREQAAKIIAYLMIGSSAADGLSTSSAPFTDVATDRWSAGYIAYCVSEGIVNGLGDGTFDPTGELTGYAFAKMLLVALGYGQDEEYIGDSWQINVAKDALKAGVYEGNLGADFNAGATREEACLYAYNTLFIETVIPDVQYDMGVKYVSSYEGTGTTLGISLYKVYEVTGVITAYDTDNDETSIAVTDDDYLPDGTYIVEATCSWYDIGMVGTVFAKFKTLSTSGLTSTYSDNVTVTDNTVGTKSNVSVSNMSSSSSSKYVCKLETAGSYDVYVNGVEVEDYITAAPAASSGTEGYYFDTTGKVLYYDDGTAVPAAVTLGYGLNISFIDNDDDNLADVITYSIYTMAKVSSVSTTNETVNFSTVSSVDFDEINGYEDLAKGDYVTYVVYGDIYYVTVCDEVEGEITSYKSTPAIYIDGTSHYESFTCDGTISGLNSGDIGDTYTFYMDADGNLIHASAVEVASEEVAYVYGAASAATDFTDYQNVQLVFPDGSVEVVVVESCDFETPGTFTEPGNGTTATANLATENAVVTYVEDDDTGYYTLTEVQAADGYYSGAMAITKGTPSFTVGADTLVATSSTIFVDIENDVVYTSYTKVPTQTVTTGAAYVEDGTAQVVFIAVTSATYSSGDYVYIYSTTYTASVIGSTTVYEYPAVINGEIGTVQSTKTTDAVSNPIVKGAYQVTGSTSAGYASALTLEESQADIALAANEQYVTYTDYSSVMTLKVAVNGYSTWILDEDTIYVLIDISAATATVVDVDSLVEDDDTSCIYVEHVGTSTTADEMTANIVYIVQP